MTLQASDLARQLAEWLNGSDITLLELTGPGTVIRLRRDRCIRSTPFMHSTALPARRVSPGTAAKM